MKPPSGPFHLYLSELAFIDHVYSRMARLFRLSLANDQFRNDIKNRMFQGPGVNKLNKTTGAESLLPLYIYIYYYEKNR